MSAPLVSIMIPTKNRPDYLKEAIESVQKQTFSDWEIIAVNDGSTDNTKEVLDQIARDDKRIKPIHTEGIGLANARNLALAVSDSKYIGFVDDDDAWLPSKQKTKSNQTIEP